jgi:prophage maintenance system killer protein
MLSRRVHVNGYELAQTDDKIAEMFEKLGEDVVDQTGFFTWVREHVKPSD